MQGNADSGGHFFRPEQRPPERHLKESIGEASLFVELIAASAAVHAPLCKVHGARWLLKIMQHACLSKHWFQFGGTVDFETFSDHAGCTK